MQALFAARLVFLVNGTLIGLFAAHIPILKERLDISEGVLGLGLLGMAGGAITAMLIGGPWLDRVGSRLGLSLGGAVMLLTLPWLAFLPETALVFACIAIFGAGNGLMDVAMNAQGAGIQAGSQRSVMSSMHGCFSLGGMLAAILTATALGTGIAAGLLLTVAACGLALALAWCWKRLVPASAEDLAGEGTRLAWPNAAIMPIALLCLAAFIGEGVMYDWSAIYLREMRSADVATAAWGFGAFSAAMALCRFLGDRIVDRLGNRRVLTLSAAIALAGYALALGVPSILASIAGFALIGMGVANIVPILFATAGRSAGRGAAIASVATFGYGGALTGPVLVGFIAEATDLTVALAMAGSLLLAVLVFGRRVQPAA